MKALVTGGAGFIGSNLVDALLARGDEVTVVDDLSTGRRENLEQALANGGVFEEVDIRDAETVGDVVGRKKPDAIFHLAAQIDVRKSVADPAADAAAFDGGVTDAGRAEREVLDAAGVAAVLADQVGADDVRVRPQGVDGHGLVVQVLAGAEARREDQDVQGANAVATDQAHG